MLALGIIFIVLSAAFLIAAATLLVSVIGLELLRSGLRRARRHRKESKELNRLSAS